MIIDLNSAPLSVAEIEAERQRIASEISVAEKSRRLLARNIKIKCIVASVVALAIIASIGIQTELMGPLAFSAAVFVASAVGAYSSVGAFVAVASFLAAVAAGAFVGAGVFVAVIAAGAVGAVIAVGNAVSKRDIIIKQLCTQLEGLENAPRESCVHIAGWLSEPVISAYRDSVVAMGRIFTHAEVTAMRCWIDEVESKRTVEAKAARIESSCRAVYAPLIAAEKD